MRSKAIITSALPYANGEIHLGHIASTYLPADVTTRFLKLKGVEAYYVCATDDFGTPILIQSEKERKTPSEYVAFWNKRDFDDFTAAGIEFDFFYKTSSSENIQFVQDVFKKLDAAGHIYQKEIIQFYCSNDKKFLPDRYVKGSCPYCKADDQ
jgi:methionyl-tRNA synthetase